MVHFVDTEDPGFADDTRFTTDTGSSRLPCKFSMRELLMIFISANVLSLAASYGSVLICTTFGLHPRAVLISTSGIFPMYLPNQWINITI